MVRRPSGGRTLLRKPSPSPAATTIAAFVTVDETESDCRASDNVVWIASAAPPTSMREPVAEPTRYAGPWSGAASVAVSLPPSSTAAAPASRVTPFRPTANACTPAVRSNSTVSFPSCRDAESAPNGVKMKPRSPRSAEEIVTMMPASAVAPASWSSVYTISAWSTNGAESPSSWASAGSKPYRQVTPRARSTASTRGKSLSAIAFAPATVASGLPYSARSAAAGSLMSTPSWPMRNCSTAQGMPDVRAVLHHPRVHLDLAGGFDQRREHGYLVGQRMPVPQVLDDQYIDEISAERFECRRVARSAQCARARRPSCGRPQARR